MSYDSHHWLDFVPQTLKASPLYTELWEHLKEDPELLALDTVVDPDQPHPITFFTTVNYLILAEPDHPLAWYYSYLHRDAAPSLSDAYPSFRAFCLAHLEELRSLLPGARLQTNEVTRCSNLLPAFELIFERGRYKPLNMIEIGSSAGLNLLWNQYHYSYGSIVVGDTASPVHISCELQGSFLPPLPERLPPVANCQGIELVPRDVYDKVDMRWLRAAIWPEELARHDVLDAAIKFAQQTPFRLHHGDACEHLPALLGAIPHDQTAVIWHSFAVNQGPIKVRERIEQQITDASRAQTIYRVSLEFLGKKGPTLEVYEYQRGKVVKQEVLAHCAVHGERMEWLLATY